MIHLSSKKLRPGMITGQGVYSSKGSFLLKRGARLTDQYIERLQKLQISSLAVTSTDEFLNLLPPEDIIQEKTRVKAVLDLCQIFEDFETTDHLDAKKLQDTSESILFDLLANRNNLAQITDIRLHDSYTFSHSVNVAVLTSMLGSFCNYSKQSLLELTLGALLHDIGKISVPENILQKPYPLDSDEYKVIRRHPDQGLQKLRAEKNFSDIVLTIVAQHHERADGSGYPKQLAEKEIHKFSRIVAIADVYDALTSNRPYKRAYRPDIAYKIMTRCSSKEFDPELLQLFFDNVAIYPVGTILKTRLGYAIVKKVETGYSRTPVIAVFTDKNHNPLNVPSIIDLKDFREDPIEYVLDDRELLDFISLRGIDPALYLAEDEPCSEATPAPVPTDPVSPAS